jgi:hypothetical protein
MVSSFELLASLKTARKATYKLLPALSAALLTRDSDTALSISIQERSPHYLLLYYPGRRRRRLSRIVTAIDPGIKKTSINIGK